jgi:hypothetical protein
MTECNSNHLGFTSLRGKKITAVFDGGQLTSDGGVLLLREAERQLQLIGRIDEVIPDPRNPIYTVHEQEHMLRQRIFCIALGYEDLNDHTDLRVDPLLQVSTGRGIDEEIPLASTSTLHRLENRINRKTAAAINATFVESFIDSFKGQPAPKELILDFDATDDIIHGHQEGRFFQGYYNHYCFLPLYVFCGQQLLVAYLRPSNIDGAKHTWAILSLLVKRIRQEWPEVRIIFRGDAGFCRWRMLRWCDRHEVGYIVGIAKNAVLLRNAGPWMAEAEQLHASSSQKQRIFGEFLYAAATWDKIRRVIIKAEHLAKGANPRFVVTNLAGDPQSLYEQLYCARGDMENRIKEQQLGLYSDRTSCHDFLANQFRVSLSAAAYILVEHIRRVGLAGTELAKAQVSTIRLKLFKIGARIQVSVRRVVLHLASAYPLKELFTEVLNRLLTLPRLRGP